MNYNGKDKELFGVYAFKLHMSEIDKSGFTNVIVFREI